MIEMNYYRSKNNKTQSGITLIALVITIIILIILGGVAFGIVIGPNGLIQKAIDSKEAQKISEITERLELVKPTAALDNLKTGMTLEEYMTALGNSDEFRGRTSDREDIEDTNSCFITVDGEYVFLIEEETTGNIKITYQGKAGKLKPRVRSITITGSTTNSITVKIDAPRAEEYEYYIRLGSGEYKNSDGGKQKSDTHVFEGLTQNSTYTIKVKAINSNGAVESIEVSEYTGTLPTGTITIDSQEWDTTTQKARVKIATSAEGYTLQYSTDANNWSTIESGSYTGYSYVAGTTIYARIFDGTNADQSESVNYAALTITKADVDISFNPIATSGNTDYPNAVNITVITKEHGTNNDTETAVSATSSNTEIATVPQGNLEDGALTITPGITAGTVTITITSAENYRFKEATATYTLTVSVDLGNAERSEVLQGYYFRSQKTNGELVSGTMPDYTGSVYEFNSSNSKWQRKTT